MIAAAARPSSFRRRGNVALFFGVFLLYMLSTSREDTYADARPIWDVAESIVYNQSITVPRLWPPDLPRGADGKIYAASPLFPSLTQVPGVALRRALSALLPRTAGLSKPLCARLSTSFLAALTVVMFFGLARRLGASAASAAITTGMLVVGTTFWVYARYPYSEILQAFCFTGLFAQLLKTRATPSAGNAAILGLWAGFLVDAKYTYVLVVPGAALYLLLYLRGNWRDVGRVALWATGPMCAALSIILFYNKARWGAYFTTGYRVTSVPVFEERVLVGLWGLFLSPGKSVFLYSPPLLLVLPAIGRLWRRWRAVFWALVATVVPSVLLNAKLIYWSGDYAWGPRYLVFAVPVLMLPVCLLIDDVLALAAGWRRRAAVATLGAVLLAGFCVQGLGNAFYWDHYIRIAKEARVRWLGQPDVSGVYTPMFGGTVCGACFEDIHPIAWLPPFQPIAGHFWLLRHAPFGDDWVKAEADAAWHRYTRLRLNIAESYSRTLGRVDFWLLDYVGDTRAVGITMLVLMSLGALGSARAFTKEVRRAAVASAGGVAAGVSPPV